MRQLFRALGQLVLPCQRQMVLGPLQEPSRINGNALQIIQRGVQYLVQQQAHMS